MALFSIKVNNQLHEVNVDPETPLLWVLRDNIGLVGTKYGCGISQCGACTVHMDGTAVRSCSLPISALDGQNITTIEGLSSDGDHPLQLAWKEHDVPQCGYCQAGQIMQASSFLQQNSNPSDHEIDQAMKGNLCRCGTYSGIREAIKTASKNL